MRDRFGAGHALKSPAHITLQMPFRWPEQAEEQVIDLLDTFRAGKAPFPITLSGFDCFPPRVIFLRILDHTPIAELASALKRDLKEKLGFSSRQVHQKFHPHLTIATRDLTEAAFQRAWPEYRERPFSASFPGHSLSLLKHNGKHWEVYRTFAFG
jgi:2'-5' RNA ligase